MTNLKTAVQAILNADTAIANLGACAKYSMDTNTSDQKGQYVDVNKQ